MSKRVCLSLAEKIKVLEKVHKGCKKMDVAAKFGNFPSCVSLIIKSRESIIKKTNMDVAAKFGNFPSCVSLIIKSRESIIKKTNVPSSRKRVRVWCYKNVNEAVLRWFSSGPYTSNRTNIDLQASDGWFSARKIRNSIGFKTVSSDSASVS
ncbi:hypothetical protein QE152_g13873 [Popillia japonica]|uniref:HTH psq-type domain-containing protein n=1 Tax=Popillia japonica TaxID=7064 RepID=A0AAW1LBA8_POPJA